MHSQQTQCGSATSDAQARPAGVVVDSPRPSEREHAPAEGLARAIESCPAAIVILGPHKRIHYVNRGFELLTGYSFKDVAGRHPNLRQAGLTISEILAEMENTVREGGVWSCEFENRRKDGSHYWERMVFSAIRSPDGAITGYVGVGDDVTEMRSTVAAMKFERSLLDGLLEALPDAIYFKDVHSRYLRIGRSMARDLCLSDPAEAVGKTDSDFFSPELAHASRADELQIIRTGRPILDKIEEGGSPDSPDICVRTSKLPLRDETGRIIGTVGISKNVTLEVQADRALRKKEARFRALTRSFEFGVIMLDRQAVVSFWNPAATRIFGYDAPGVLGQPVPALLCRHGRPVNLARMFTNACARGGRKFDGRTWEMEARRKDGHIVPVDVSLATFEVDGEWQGVCIIRDTTQRQQIEAALRERDSQLQQALEAARLGTWHLDLASGLIEWGGCHTEILGTDGRTIGNLEAFTGLIPPDDRDSFLQALEKARSMHGIYSHRHRLVRPDGSIRWVAERGRCIFGADGNPEAIRGIISDITEKVEASEERNRLQAQVDQAQKLESIGRLAAGIAHEINTPTQYIGDNTRFLQDGFRDLARLLELYRSGGHGGTGEGGGDELFARAAELEKSIDLEFLLEEIPRAIEQTLEGVARVSKIVGAMKDFSHPGLEKMAAINLNHAIESTVEVARSEWKYVATMKLELESSLPPVVCHPGQINQVILNLVVNAAHAIGDKFASMGGQLGEIVIRTEAVDSDRIAISVSDNGGGIPESVRHKIFTPFFTTKGVGRGTGQGLALARSVIVEQHKGTIDFESEENVGTTFRIVLPCHQDAQSDQEENS